MRGRMARPGRGRKGELGQGVRRAGRCHSRQRLISPRPLVYGTQVVGLFAYV